MLRRSQFHCTLNHMQRVLWCVLLCVLQCVLRGLYMKTHYQHLPLRGGVASEGPNDKSSSYVYCNAHRNTHRNTHHHTHRNTHCNSYYNSQCNTQRNTHRNTHDTTHYATHYSKHYTHTHTHHTTPYPTLQIYVLKIVSLYIHRALMSCYI